MNFEQLYAPSLKELFVQKLQGMILSGELPMGENYPQSGNFASRWVSPVLLSTAALQNWLVRAFGSASPSGRLCCRLSP